LFGALLNLWIPFLIVICYVRWFDAWCGEFSAGTTIIIFKQEQIYVFSTHLRFLASLAHLYNMLSGRNAVEGVCKVTILETNRFARSIYY
jgi:hypothetical protein